MNSYNKKFNYTWNTSISYIFYSTGTFTTAIFILKTFTANLHL